VLPEPGAADPDGAVVPVIGRLARLPLHIRLLPVLVHKDVEAALGISDDVPQSFVDGRRSVSHLLQN